MAKYEIRCIERGKKFNDINEAANWATQESGKRVNPGNILNSCFGITKTSAGFTWKFEGIDEDLYDIGWNISDDVLKFNEFKAKLNGEIKELLLKL